MARLMYQISTASRKKRILAIPESHTLYLCPNACARRRGLRALRNGVMDDVSFLRFSQTDIVTGSYERRAIEACDRLLASLPRRPRVISLYVNCIDDFIGTDARALVDELSSLHPDVRFILSRINPISDDVSKTKLQSIHMRLYEPLEPEAEHDGGVTLLGHFEEVPAASEFHRIVAILGLGPIRQVFTCADFDEYGLLAKSRLALSLSRLGDAALDDFDGRLGVAGMRWHASYALDEIGRRYRRLAALCGGSVDCAEYATEARTAVERARAAVGGRPIAVDSSASLMPFTLALDLLSYGFNVRAVFALHAKADDSDAARRLAEEYPEVDVVRDGGAEAVRGASHDAKGAAWIAVGSDAAFLLETPCTVDMYHDEGHFGFQGVKALMEGLCSAVEDGRGGKA